MFNTDTMFSSMDISDICSLPGITGPCLMLVDRWYYNVNDGECKYFTYSGCGGNYNNFETLHLCEETCMDITTFNSDNAGFSRYHIAGFIMIFIVIYLFFCLYYLSIKQDNKSFEPHQHRLVTKKDKINKYNKCECLFVSNIAKQLFESDIKELFDDYGEIVSFNFKETRGDQLNICLVEFESVDDANRAMYELNGMEIEDHMLCIKWYEDPITTTMTTPNKKQNKTKMSNNSNNEKRVVITIDTVDNIDNVLSIKADETTKINSTKIENNNNFLKQNVASPSGDNLYSTTMSMHQVDSDFQYYEDSNNEAINASDSSEIDFADNQQISALKRFVAKKLTMDDDNHNDYVGIGIEED